MDCKDHKQPMIVLREHKGGITYEEQGEAISICNFLFGKYEQDYVWRETGPVKIPDHWHWHIEIV